VARSCALIGRAEETPGRPRATTRGRTPTLSTTRKGAKFLALLAGGSLFLTACSTGGGSGSGEETTDGAAGETQDVTITVAHEQEFGSYNNNTAEENAVKNTVVLNQVLRGFWFFGEDGSVVPDTEFGTYEKTSDDPLTVKYTFADGAKWSDGEAIDCDDFLLVWAANSGKYTTGETDEEGNPALLFSTAGTTGYDIMDKPECADGDTEVTVTYQEPFADWQANFGSFLPAHVVEEQAGGIDLVDAITNDDQEALTSAAEFYNTGWVFNPGEIDTAITPSAGPYQIDSWQAGQSLTLTANPEWWGTPAKSKNIVIRFIPQEQQAQALANGEIQIAEPQPNPDVVQQLEGLGDQVEVVQGDEYTYEHLDFNFGGAFADADLRKAFALCVPRQLIIDNLIKPVNPNAEVMNSRYAFPFSPEYADVTGASYDGTYDEANVEEAKAILDGKGAAGTVVRIGYQTPNQRRTNATDLIRSSCNQAGFDVQDAGQEDFFGNGLAAGNFDVALFAWAGSPLVTGSSSTFVTGGGNNNGKYSNPEVDTLINELNVTPDLDAQQELVSQVEKILWTDLATIPIFAFPGVVAHASNIEGVSFQPSQSQVTWNMHEWTVAE
jgi:peptide/nickel transport system substrate-binding protein